MLFSRPKAWATASLILALGAGAREARAQTSANDKAAAEALFQEAKALFQQGQYEQACAKFAASQELDGGFGTLMNLGECFEKRKLTASAWATFKEAAGLARTQGQNDREAAARERAALLEARLSTLVVQASAEVTAIEGLAMRLNGTALPRAVWGTPVPVDPGTQRVELEAPGYRAFSREVAVAEGTGPVVLEVPALDPAAPTAVSPPPASPVTAPASSAPLHAGGETQRTVGYGVGGVGVAGMIVGSIFGLRAISKNGESQDSCRTEKLCSERGLELRDEARTAARVSTVAFIAGGVLVGTGLTLVLTAAGSREASPSARATRREPRLSRRLELASVVVPTGASVTLRGEF